ncbi:hypothetical protein GCM10010507_20650 [Streptomyces cinnamoneus]|uniref:Membrane transport protein MMPL domain-containing protein n=1 Tax=Streptomyces cinnamoneus TaxID=53446 RepID=A0A918THB8_STRCJ|nr:hypothetical protein GCM10010507_20650 [Streptomyces cinnamoneus]
MSPTVATTGTSHPKRLFGRGACWGQWRRPLRGTRIWGLPVRLRATGCCRLYGQVGQAGQAGQGGPVAVSVLIDAIVIRLLLVPASTTLLGTGNWWAPRWLDRILPRFDPEGRDSARLS